MSIAVGQTAGGRRPESRMRATAAAIDAVPTKRTTRFIGPTVAVVIGLIGSLAIIATPAAAAVPGLIRVSATSESTPHDAKTMVVACPAGKKLVGTGARINGGLGEVVLTSLQPNGSPTVAPTSVTAIAQEADPLSSNWSLTVYGICADPLPGLVRMSDKSSDSHSEDLKVAHAECPTGKWVVGTGFTIAFGHGQVSVGGVQPGGTIDVNPPVFVHVHAAESDGYAEYWTLIAYAICATPPAGLQVYTADTSWNSDDKSVVAPCPPGKKMLGAGVTHDGPHGQIVLNDFAPNGGPATPPTSVQVTEYEEDFVPVIWRVLAYAICATTWK